MPTINLFKKQGEAFLSKKQFILVCCGVQSGKGLWEEEPVLTIEGYKPIKEIKVGETLFDRNGEKTKVEKIFRRGEQPCYEVSFTDGKSIIVDADHLWVVIDPHCRGEKIYSTEELFNKKKGNGISVPTCKIIDFPEKIYPSENKFISNIKPVGLRKTICIQVDSPTSTFIAKNQIVSHNTYLGATWARNKIDKFPNKNGLISAPTYKILNQSTLDKFFSLFPELRKFYKEQKSIIELPTGGKVFIRSADQPLGIEGMTVHWAWLDEYGQAPKLAWTVVRSRVSTTGGQVMITTTPYAMNWLYGDIYERWSKKEDSDIAVFTWKSIENPFFPKSYYDKERTRLSKEEFRRRYEGEFSRMEGLVYEDFTTDLIIEPRVIEGISTTAGVDFGFTNPTAIEVIRKDKDGKFYVIDEYYEAGKTQEEINQACLFFKKKHNIKAFYPDIAEPDRIASMRKAGLVCIEEKKDIAVGIDKVRSLFREKRLFVFRTCSNLIDELQTYHYQEQDEKEIKEEPVKEKDHACDAIRYNIAAERDIGKAEYLGDIKQKKFRMPANDFRIDIDKIIKENQEYQNQDSWKY